MCKRLLPQQVNSVVVANGMHWDPREAYCVAWAPSVSVFWSEREVSESVWMVKLTEAASES